MHPRVQGAVEILAGARTADRRPLRMNSGIDNKVIDAISS